MMTKRKSAGTSAAAIVLALSGCGGGDVASTPTPTISSPVHALGVTSGTTSYATLSTHTTQQLLASDGGIISTSAGRAGLTFKYDASKDLYEISGSGATSSFGDKQYRGDESSGDARFLRDDNGSREYLTLFNPQRLGSGTKSVSLGLWQRGASATDLNIDVFVYGFPTRQADVPLSGSATYDIDLFGVASPTGSFPRSVVGDGTFSLDFSHGVFAMSGQAGEYNNDADYSTCCALWNGAGSLASSGGLTGYFTYDGRDGHTYQASILGALYGPKGREVGGSILGQAGSDATFTGAFAGTREHDGIDASLSVLDKGARTYSSFQGTSVASQRPGAISSDGGAYYWPAAYGSVAFGADGSMTPMFNVNDSRFANVTFKPSDLLQSQSDNRFDVYEVHNADGDYRLELFKPGPGNPEIELTYSSFGHWREDRAIGNVTRQSISTWFTYGVRTANGTLPTNGSAHFSAAVLGSGERFGDMEQLTLKGTSQIDIDFATARINGTLNANAWTSANEKIDLPSMTFSAQGNAYAFDTNLFDAAGSSPGSIRGSLYGPGGQEVGGTFEFATRVSQGGAVDAGYSGVFYGKRN